MLFIHHDQGRGWAGEVNTAERVPITMRARPPWAERQASRRRVPVRAGMQDDDTGAEPPPEALDQLRSQGDFGHEHQCLAAAGQRGGNGTQIHLGLAAAGHTVEKVRGETA